MRVPSSLATAVSLLIAFASLALAGDAKTYKLVLHDRWKAGDAVTRSSTEVQHQAIKVEKGDGTVVKDDSSDVTTTYVRVEKCTDADADGRWTKGLVRFVEWSRVSGAEKDESLKGVVIELAGDAGARAWKTVSEGASPSSAAKAWFDGELGPDSHHDKSDAAMEPKAEVAVGESWPPDLAGFAEMLSKNLPVDAEKADGKVTLKSVDGVRGTIDFELKLPTKGLPIPQSGTTMAWVEGGTLTAKGSGSRPIDGSLAPSEGSVEHVLKGIA